LPGCHQVLHEIKTTVRMVWTMAALSSSSSPAKLTSLQRFSRYTLLKTGIYRSLLTRTVTGLSARMMR
jgi:hypothetical protein